MTWGRKLSRPIALSDGRELATLRNAAECLIATFDGSARDLFIAQAETGRRRDVAAATDQVAVVLGRRKPV